MDWLRAGSLGSSRKKLIAYAVIGLCLVSAVLSYFLLSDNTPKETPKLKETELKAQAIQDGIAHEQAKQPTPPPSPAPPPRVGRGPTAVPK